MIPENKIELVEKALNTAFNTNRYERIEKITTGLSGALVFRIEVKGQPYLLRIIMRTDAMADPAKHFECMEAAALAGIAPKVSYASVEDRLSITDFIEAKPFPLEAARMKLPGLLRKLHALPSFHPVMNVFDMAGLYIRKVKDLNILSNAEMNEIMEGYEQIASVYPFEKEELVSCHNDLKPENIIYDGQKPWIVDWEAAFMNVKYADLAIIANFVTTNPEEETAFLKNYLGQEPTAFESACFYLVRQALHVNYFTVFLAILSYAGKPIDLGNHPQYSYREFHHRMWSGEFSLAEDEPRLHYALLHKVEFQNSIRSQRFRDALSLISETRMN